MPIVFKPIDPNLKHLTLTLDVGIEAHEAYHAKVSSILDGDTLEAAITIIGEAGSTGTVQSTTAGQSSGVIDRIRLLAIDAPETKAGDHAKAQCQYLGIDINLLIVLAKLSTFHLRWLCPNGTRLTIKTTGKARDDYDRILAGLFVGDLCLNRAMVEHGYAMAYQGATDWESYHELETMAREAKRGIWGQCEEAYYLASAKTYHRPGCTSAPYTGTRLSTVKEAKARGFKPCSTCIPDFTR